jgi:integrase
MKLSATAIKNARPRQRAYKLADGGGLYLLVQPIGSKLWRYDFRLNKKRRTMALGKWPAVGLADARTRHAAAAARVARGEDPIRADAAEQRDTRLETIFREWWAAQVSGWTDRYAGTVIRRLERNVFPELGRKPIAEVKSADVLKIVRAIEQRGAITAARRVKSYCLAAFDFAKAEGLVETNPAADIGKLLKAKPPRKRRAALKATDLPAFLVKLRDSEDEEEDTLDAMWLTLLTAVRTVETRFAACEEFEALDKPGAETWRISPTRMKMKNEHLVPLSRQAAAIVCRRVAKVGGRGLLFPRRTVSGVISENTMLYALYRMGYHSKATVHGFRGTFSTILNETTRQDASGAVVRMFDSDWIERQLAHVEEDEVRGAYNAAEWIGPRRAMLQWWADYLDRQEEIGRLLG